MKMNENEHGKWGSNLVRNWISLSGLVLTACGLFAVACLVAIDSFQGFTSVYMGLLTYMIIPGFIWMGFFLIGVGAWRERRRLKERGAAAAPPMGGLDLSNPRQRRNLAVALSCGFLFMLLSAFGSFRAHQVTESVPFCGTLCHTVMEPEHTTYQNSPHARVSCTACHIGPGASWFVRSKISGLYQVYAVATNSYPRPIPVPVKNLRPARETCEGCHWPEKFFGAVELFHKHFLYDKQNTPWTIRMLVKVGGANPAHGPVGGIHWHMIVANRIEYIPADESRMSIPWIRLTNLKDGRVVVYESKDNPLTPEQKKAQPVRLLDCIDCHNRPTHIFRSPSHALDVSLWLNRIDPSIPFIKQKAATALIQSAGMGSQAQGVDQLAGNLAGEYKDHGDQQKIQQAVSETQQIFRDNFFPEMKTSWSVRPDNIGHRLWPGCFRCHDGRHAAQTGEGVTTRCNACHTILAQGYEPGHKVVSLEGLEFDHPGGEIAQGELCSDCHTGSPQ